MEDLISTKTKTIIEFRFIVLILVVSSPDALVSDVAVGGN